MGRLLGGILTRFGGEGAKQALVSPEAYTRRLETTILILILVVSVHRSYGGGIAAVARARPQGVAP